MSTRILIVDDEPDALSVSQQHFRRDLRSGRFTVEFATSESAASTRPSSQIWPGDRPHLRNGDARDGE